MRRVVIIESPYQGEVMRNRRYRDMAMRDAIMHHNEVPLASHKLFVGPLDESLPHEREVGIALGYELWTMAAVVVFYTDFGMSPGMNRAVALARDTRKPTAFRELGADALVQVAVKAGYPFDGDFLPGLIHHTVHDAMTALKPKLALALHPGEGDEAIRDAAAEVSSDVLDELSRRYVLNERFR
jgi:hypothetical protein